jgi:hypothetical protein
LTKLKIEIECEFIGDMDRLKEVLVEPAFRDGIMILKEWGGVVDKFGVTKSIPMVAFAFGGIGDEPNGYYYAWKRLLEDYDREQMLETLDRPLTDEEIAVLDEVYAVGSIDRG